MVLRKPHTWRFCVIYVSNYYYKLSQAGDFFLSDNFKPIYDACVKCACKGAIVCVHFIKSNNIFSLSLLSYPFDTRIVPFIIRIVVVFRTTIMGLCLYSSFNICFSSILSLSSYCNQIRYQTTIYKMNKMLKKQRLMRSYNVGQQ